MQQYTETVIAGNIPHQSHHQQVVVIRQVTFLKDGSQFKLVWSDLVVACLDRDAEFESLYFKFGHKAQDALWNDTEIVVIQLLVLACRMSHEGAPCHDKVGSCYEQSLVHEEEFLFPSEVTVHPFDVAVEVVGYRHSGFVDS